MVNDFCGLFQKLQQLSQSLHPKDSAAAFQKILQEATEFQKFVLTYQWPRPLPHAYSRSFIFTSNEFEVMVARWQQGDPCAPHDHGGAQGFVWFVQGEFVETEYHFTNAALHKDREWYWKADDLVEVSPNEIHDCEAKTAGLSVHFYWPHTRSMQVYLPKEKKTLIVDGSVGAWQQIDSTAILKTWDWKGV